jgi:hypothetical protein
MREVIAMHTAHPRFLLCLLGDVSSMLRELTVRLRDRTTVTKVERQCEIVGGEQPSIEWHVDADLASRDSYSWRLLLYWSGEAWVVEADTRRFSAGASRVEDEFAPRIVAGEDLDVQLLSATAELVRAGPPDSLGW